MIEGTTIAELRKTLSRVYKGKRLGYPYINGKRVSEARVLKEDDTVEFRLPSSNIPITAS